MKITHFAGTVVLALLLGACATSSTKPTVLQAMSAEQVQTLKLKTITATAAPGVVMTASDFERIVMKVKNELSATTPGILIDPTSPEAAAASEMKLNFTQYDAGSAFARAMLIGLGQIHVDADIQILDPSGATTGKYQVSKDFALGGVAGASTSIQDVEDGFAKSVAEIVKKN
ncbi:DUF4410 domain-containing protein [Rhizomicrobium electricum]|uniref:DUF4410 domain-containing protein n=1 Tax=Rhizomicrobium electricum TaxID=480070 RepID=A0ABN1EH45_9PROT|nr:DUF4410 domain-containing protein [Rhizomicrobium electricum]NIJ48481.1 hypothetical protein [Rhizomicrobium electricum]